MNFIFCFKSYCDFIWKFFFVKNLFSDLAENGSTAAPTMNLCNPKTHEEDALEKNPRSTSLFTMQLTWWTTLTIWPGDDRSAWWWTERDELSYFLLERFPGVFLLFSRAADQGQEGAFFECENRCNEVGERNREKLWTSLKFYFSLELCWEFYWVFSLRVLFISIFIAI